MLSKSVLGFMAGRECGQQLVFEGSIGQTWPEGLLIIHRRFDALSLLHLHYTQDTYLCHKNGQRSQFPEGLSWLKAAAFSSQ